MKIKGYVRWLLSCEWVLRADSVGGRRRAAASVPGSAVTAGATRPAAAWWPAPGPIRYEPTLTLTATLHHTATGLFISRTAENKSENQCNTRLKYTSRPPVTPLFINGSTNVHLKFEWSFHFR